MTEPRRLLDGRSMVDLAVERLRFHEPPEGYYLAFSGGKDSQAILHLADLAGIKYDAHYHQTGIDPPELVQFIRRQYPQVQRELQSPSFWRLVEYHGLPRRQGRWCCEELKEGGGTGRIVVTGVRWQESVQRRQRQYFERCHSDEKHYLHPIIDWTTADVWAFLGERPHCVLYDEGYKRLGCVLCPMTSHAQTLRDMARWPKLAEAWHRAALRYWAKSEAAQKRFPSGEHLWRWWLTRRASPDPAQCVMFE